MHLVVTELRPQSSTMTNTRLQPKVCEVDSFIIHVFRHNVTGLKEKKITNDPLPNSLFITTGWF